jgi:hypothetical protein
VEDYFRGQKLTNLQSQPRKPVYPTLEALAATQAGTSTIYRYTDPANAEKIDMAVVRLDSHDGKHFLQARPVPGGFIAEAPPKPWPLYNRKRVAEAKQVIVVEGEKCVHALHRIGIVATTSPGGANNAGSADWSPLAGKKVILWADNDMAGVKHMRAVAKLCDKLTPAPLMRWIDPTALELAEKGDAADYVAREGDGAGAKITELCERAESLGPAAEIAERLNAMIQGTYRAVPWPWPYLTEATRALLPGAVTLLCGDPGTTKSYFLLEAAAYWHAEQCSVAVFELEEDREYHARRRLAQEAGDSRVTDTGWCAAHGDEAKKLLGNHQDAIDSFGKRIWDAPASEVTLSALADWVEARANEGCRIICVDPLTAAAVEGKQWEDDKMFIMRAKKAIVQADASLVLVTHPGKGQGPPSMDRLAGGAAYQRFSQCILWISHADKPQCYVQTSLGRDPAPVEANKIVKIFKARNAKGAGTALAFTFNPDTFTFHEHGYLAKEK